MEQDRLLEHHSDLYWRHDHGFAALALRHGQLRLDSVNRAPYGVAYLPDMEQFTPWVFYSK